MESIAKVLLSFMLATALMGLAYILSLGFMSLVALSMTHPAIGSPIFVFIWMCCVWAFHHGLSRY